MPKKRTKPDNKIVMIVVILIVGGPLSMYRRVADVIIEIAGRR
jgi:hypothetical protein